jgi:hypothetical protein
MTATRRVLSALLAGLLAIALLAGCGHTKVGSKQGCVVVDVSGSSRPLIETTYQAGFAKFVERVTKTGSGNVCFAFVGAGTSGGAAATAPLGCSNPDDVLRCRGQIRTNVAAASQQLAAVSRQIAGVHGHNQFAGASRLLEAIHDVAPATHPGDEILVLSDAIQSSGLTGDFNHGQALALDEADDQRIIGRLRDAHLLPDLSGRTLRIPYPLVEANGVSRWSDARKQKLQRFYEDYADATHAQLRYGHGNADA